MGQAIKTLVVAAVIACAGQAQAAEDRPAYDKKIEAAAIRILQNKIGDMRGSLTLGDRNVFMASLRSRTRAYEIIGGQQTANNEPRSYARITWN